MSTIYVNNILPTTGDTTTVSGSFKVTGSMQVTGNVFMAGNLTVEGTTTTVNSTAVNVTSSLTFEGPADAHETTLHAGGDGTGAAPSADTTIYLPAMSAGSYYLPVLAAASTTSITSTPAELNILDGVTADKDEINLLDGASAGTVVNSKAVIYSSDGDIAVGDNLTLTSDSSVLSMGVGADFTITHDGTTGATLAGTPISINSTGDLTLDSSTDVVIDAAGGNVEFKDDGTLQLSLDMDGTAGAQVLKLGVDSDDLIIQQYDGTEVARFTDTARVGIGENSPQLPLHVTKDAATSPTYANTPCVILEDDDRPGLQLVGSSNNIGIIQFGDRDSSNSGEIYYDHSADQFNFRNAGTVSTVIDSSGKLGVGLTSPKTQLTVEGAVTLKEQSAADGDTAAYGQLWVKDDTPNNLYFTNDAGNDVQITNGSSLAVTGDITGVTAGDGLSGGGTSGGVTLALDLDELTGATIADGDSIVFIDANDSNASRKETLSDFLDVVAGTVATTGLDRSGATLVVSDLHPVGVDGAANQLLTDDGDGTVSSEGNLTFDGSILKVVGNLSGSGTSHVVGAATFGNQVSMTGSLTIGADSDGTDRTVTFGHSTLKTIMGIDDSADAFVINTDNAFDATLANNSLSIDASHNMIVAGNITGKGRVLVDDATEATSTTDGSLQTDGGLSVAKSAVIGDDLDLLSDGAIISFGTDKEITLTHEADVGLILEGNGQSADPTLTIKNTNADATGGSLKFLKDGSSVADADVIGNITFVSEDDGSNAHTYASIIGSISDMTAGAEGGKLQFNVAEHDGTVTQGLLIADGDADGEIDVTVGAGAASVVTVPGVLNVANDIILDDGGSIKEGGGTAAITIDGSGNVTKIGQDSPSSGEFLKYDGSKWVADSASSGGAVSAVANGADNRIATFSSSDALNGEANLTFNGSILKVVGAISGSSTAHIVGAVTAGSSLATTGSITAGTDLSVGDDLSLTSDSAVFNMGAGNDFTITHDGTTGATIAGNPIIVDSGGNLTLDAHTGIFILKDAGSEVLRLTEGNSGDVTVKLETNGKDLIFTDNGDAEGFRILDAAVGVKVPGEVRTTMIAFTDGDDAMGVADGGGVTFANTVKLGDDKTLTFGSDDDVTIEYDEDGTDALLITGDTFTFNSANASDPLIQIFNSTNDANGSRLRFVKNRGTGAGQDNDVIGVVEFVSHDDGSNDTAFADIRAQIADASDGTEGGKLEFRVASHDGGIESGLILTDGDADGEVDVTVGAGAASLTTVSGDLTVTGADIVVGADSDGTDRTIVFGHSTLKSVIGIDDGTDTFVINTDATFEGTAANNSLSIDANHTMTVGGSIRAKGFPAFTYHQYAIASAGERWVPWYDKGDLALGSATELVQAVAPFDGRLVKVFFRPEDHQGGGDTKITLYKLGNGTAHMDSSRTFCEHQSVACSSNASTTNTFTFSGSQHFSAGEVIGITVDPQNNPGEVNITCMWEYAIIGVQCIIILMHMVV